MNLNKHMKFNGAENHPSGVFNLMLILESKCRLIGIRSTINYLIIDFTVNDKSLNCFDKTQNGF